MAYDIEIKRNDTRRHVFFLKINDVAVDISSWSDFTLTANAEKKPLDNTNEVGFIAGAFTTDGQDGGVFFTPPGDWAIGKYFYDIQAIDANGERFTILDGKYAVKQDITKS